jgi:flagellar hook-basal body complex protein FliE
MAMQITPGQIGTIPLGSRTISAEAEPQPSFAAIAAEFERRLRAGEAVARDAMLGRADPHALIEALSSTQTAATVSTAVRDRVVEAYQEILRMPV